MTLPSALRLPPSLAGTALFASSFRRGLGSYKIPVVAPERGDVGKADRGVSAKQLNLLYSDIFRLLAQSECVMRNYCEGAGFVLSL